MKAVMSLHEGAKTRVRVGLAFEVKVGVHRVVAVGFWYCG